MQQIQRRRARAAALWATSCLALGCASPDLARTLFSCATSADCAPGQQCVAFQGELACQFASGSSASSIPGVAADTAPLLPATPLENPSREEAPPLDAPLADANQRDGADTASGADTAGADGAGALPTERAPDPTSADAGGALPAPPSVRFDFESGLEGWRMDLNQRPVDTLDSVEASTTLAHHGSGALRMAFDGSFTPIPPFGFDPSPFFGIFQVSPPPPGVDVSLWMLATTPGMSVEVYTLSGDAFTWTVLATVPLPVDQWREITVAMPLAQAQQLGIRLYSPLDFAGEVYLDEIRW